MEAAKDNAQRLTFRDLSQAAVDAWARFGFSWQEIVDGFGGGSGGLGMPPFDDFCDLARWAVQAELSGLPGKEECRLMRSRLYQKHQDVELHYDFTHGKVNYSHHALGRFPHCDRACNATIFPNFYYRNSQELRVKTGKTAKWKTASRGSFGLSSRSVGLSLQAAPGQFLRVGLFAICDPISCFGNI